MTWFQSKNARTSAVSPRGPLHRFLREWVVPIGLVMAVMAPIRSVVADWNDVPSGSMRPTILEGDRIYVNKLAFGLRLPFTHTWLARWDEPRRGDIATFASPADGIRLVKRIVGVPGDRVELRDNHLIVNGVEAGLSVTGASSGTLPSGATVPVTLATESFAGVDHAIAITPSIDGRSSFAPTIVPEGKFFVMGDNRDQSYDSRYWGFADEVDVKGQATFIYWSWDSQRHWVRWDRFGHFVR